MGSGRRRLVTAIVVGALLAIVSPARASSGPPSAELLASTVAPDNGRTCRTSTVPVDLELGLLVLPGADIGLPLGDLVGPQHVFVKLCLPEGETPSTVQLLVHGITYDHRYWNIADPDDPRSDRYSWEAAAAEAGYATLAIDRIGAGRSSHPLSALVDINSNAAVVQQVVTALRDGTIASPAGPVAFEHVVLVGHSYGSMTSWFTASRFHDVDGLVITGATHNVREIQAPLSIEAQHYPALFDPQFAGRGLDPGYVTSRPGTREQLFYQGMTSAPGTGADPRIIARDEATKGTVSQFELVNYPLVFRTVLDVRAPVLLLIGSHDGIFCSLGALDLGAPCETAAGLVASERPWYGSKVPSLDAVVLPTTGHNLNAFPTSQVAFDAAMRWLTTTVPPTNR
jgi:pimeloyl-ACP methyl ester carboxylesterase